MLQKAIDTVREALGLETSTTAIIKGSDGTRIVAKFDTPDEKEQWLDYLEDTTPSNVSYYDTITEAMHNPEGHEYEY